MPHIMLYDCKHIDVITYNFTTKSWYYDENYQPVLFSNRNKKFTTRIQSCNKFHYYNRTMYKMKSQ